MFRNEPVMKRFPLLFVSALLVFPLSADQNVTEADKGIVPLSKKFAQRKKSSSKKYIIVNEDDVNRSGMPELQIGNAPTKEQLKGLKEDMVWIKEEEIAGFKMLFPVVYLAEEEEKEEQNKTGRKEGRTKRTRALPEPEKTQPPSP